jgi:predicted transcriptional regulator
VHFVIALIMEFHYRDRIDVIVSILDIANGNEVRQADILRRANIPGNLFKEYLLLLYPCGLIEIRHMHNQRIFMTTVKGMHFLKICDKMRAFLETSSSWNKPYNMELSTYTSSL